MSEATTSTAIYRGMDRPDGASALRPGGSRLLIKA